MNYKVITKEKYQPPEDGSAVYISQAIMLIDEGSKYLALQLMNGGVETVTGIKLQITEMDGRGNELRKTTEEIPMLNVDAGYESVLDSKIKMLDRCERFSIVLEYVAMGVGIKMSERKFSASMRRNKIPKIIGIFAILIVGLSVGLNLIGLTFYQGSMDGFSLSGIEYAFINGDNSPGAPVLVKGYSGSQKEVELPQSVGGQPVIGIADNAFLGNRTLEKLTVKGIRSIGSGAFSGCTNLREVLIENSAEGDRADASATLTLGSGVFAGSSSLKKLEIRGQIDFPQTADFLRGSTSIEVLRLQNLGDSMTVVELFGVKPDAGTFFSLTELSINTVGAISEDFCYGMSNLKKLTIENTEATEVGARAFFGCSSLNEWKLPNKLTSVGALAFAGTAIKTFDASELEFLGEGAFSDCRSLTLFDLSSNKELTEIVIDAFAGCTSLRQVPLSPETKLTSIGESAFEGCELLLDLPLISSVESIGARAFAGCKSLMTALLPRNLVSIGKGAFLGCESLRELTVPFIGGSANENTYLAYLFGAETINEAARVPASLKIVRLMETDYEVSIASRAFFGLGHLEEIEIPATLKQIGDNAFERCYRLFEIVNHSALDIECGSQSNGMVGYYALNIYRASDELRGERYEKDGFVFMQASDGEWFLTDYDRSAAVLHFPERFEIDGVEVNAYVLPEMLMRGNLKINELTVPNAVTRIGFGAFAGCDSIKKLSIPFAGGSADSDGFVGFLFGANKPQNSNFIPDSLTTVSITGGHQISSNAFYEMDALTRVELPKSLESIGDEAFAGCVNLYEVYNPSGLPIAKGSRDYGSVALYAVAVYDEDGHTLQQTTIDGIVYLHSGSDWSIIGYEGTASSLTLTSFVYEGETVAAYSIKRNAFADAKTLENITIDAPIGRIEDGAFSGCVNLKSITLPEGLIGIGNGAFRNCKNLLSIRIPASVKEIGESAFRNCFRLYDVVNLSGLPASIGTVDSGHLGYYAFRLSTDPNAEEMRLVEVGDCIFMCLDNKWYLYSVSGDVNTLVLPSSFEFSGVTISSYSILENAFEQVFCGEIVIPLSVTGLIRSHDILFYDLGIIYYGGGKEQWSTLIGGLPSNSSLHKNPVHYNAPTVQHNFGEDGKCVVCGAQQTDATRYMPDSNRKNVLEKSAFTITSTASLSKVCAMKEEMDTNKSCYCLKDFLDNETVTILRKNCA